MAEESSGTRPQRGLWNSPVLTALVTGLFGVLTAGIGYLAILREPADEISPPQQVAIAAESAASIEPASINTTPHSTAATNLLLNFAAFQERMASTDVKGQERDLIIRPLLNHKVVWKGYIDQITPADQPTDAVAVTVSLVETAEKTGQSMFKMPALCRFGPDSVDGLAALAPGDLVTITGTFSDHSLIGTEITSAHLMSVNGHTTSRLATGPASGSVTR